MRIMVLGLRGFPDVQGGIEAHAEHLYPLLVKMGCVVEVIVRSGYVSASQDCWRGIRFHRIWAPKLKGLEAFLHSFLGVIYAGFKRPDVLHIHAIGPALMAPLARLMGLQVVVTHHGFDYDREKWGRFARWILRIGERLGMKFASRRIVISEYIRASVQEHYHRDSVVIPNGVVSPKIPETTDALERFGLTPRRYILLVSRLVPEKRHLDLIQAFSSAGLQGWQLVLVGDTDHPDEYSSKVLSVAGETEGVVVTSFQTGIALKELYANAGIFVLPSSHEGLPIVLLEALSYGIPALASNIPANLAVGLPAEQYFEQGNISVLSKLLREYSGLEIDHECRARQCAWIKEFYDWQRIAQKTLAVYREVVTK